MGASVSIRPVTPQDTAAISVLMRGLGFNHSAEEIERRLDLAPSRATDPAFLAENREHGPVGLLAVHIAPLLFYPAPLARITTIVVAEAARRQGIGRALIHFAADLAKQAGCETLELTTGLNREGAHVFYETLGFQRSGLRVSRQIV
ncbi:GNAT family N-acetyltransferase [Ancylobacter sp. Lp-2]|uniref:GNAT family N-acetyltransferase n=1 Tax=Ancylobacter sp. Lp-2 TaxID=2881339 RepID=UPI001E478757|nr:GNAT family N-acetyltransferase [Ancylobacter sp. Lp-2]MCB4767645.1 GNAT family N-acetyltransferase [Ancylobacter sp. Lp-2]